MDEKFEFSNFKDVPINEGKWISLKSLLEAASKDDEEGLRLRTIFEMRGDDKREEKLEVLSRFEIYEEDLKEIHQYLESIFHDSPLKFWWW